MNMKTHFRLCGVVALASFAACGGGSTTGDLQTGKMSFAITDAPSDEIQSFRVEVEQITVTDLDGTVFDTLATPVEVDLAQLTDVSQLIGHLVIADGRYREAELTLDFTNAVCVLVGETTPAAIEDTSGAALSGTLTLPISFAGTGMNLFSGRHRVLEFDFDLDQSVSVDALNNVVVVDPIVVLRVNRADPKEFVAFGELTSVDTNANTIALELQTLGGAELGDVLYEADLNTVYQVDGVPFVGSAGLAALAALPAHSWVQAYGATTVLDRNFQALYVEAGAGTFNGGQDIVEGFVVGRNGGAGADALLQVLGRSQNAAHTQFLYDTLFTIDASFANTKVLERGSATAFDLDDVNVGQMVRVFGSLGGTDLDASTASGVVRLQPTRIFGYANAAPAGGLLEIDLTRVGLRPESDFTWSEGGSSAPDPTQFVLDVGVLGGALDIVNGTAVEAIGTFPAIDDNGADFVASALANRDDAPSYMLIRDRFAGLFVDVTTNAGSLAFDISGIAVAGEIAVIDKGLAGQLALPTSPTPSVEPNTTAVLCILHDKDTGAVQLYSEFDDFSSALGVALSSAGRLSTFGALGDYDDVDNRLTATLIVAVVD